MEFHGILWILIGFQLDFDGLQWDFDGFCSGILTRFNSKWVLVLELVGFFHGDRIGSYSEHVGKLKQTPEQDWGI